MDALPVVEQSGEEFASRNGAMHACGHDLHTAMPSGLRACWRRGESTLQGDVVLMFHPGEEGFDGARMMIEQGLLQSAGAIPVAAYAFHVEAVYPSRRLFAARPGTMFSASNELKVVVTGRGGHGSTPSEALDPIPVAAEIILALQAFVTRRFDVFDPVVISVGAIKGGHASNVIPDSVAFDATVRCFSTEALERLREGTVRVCRSIAEAHGMQAQATFSTVYPATINHHEETEWALDVMRGSFGSERVEVAANPMTQSEDFSRVLQRVPGAMLLIGASPADAPERGQPSNHSAEVRFDDSILHDGAAAYAVLAEQRLRSE